MVWKIKILNLGTTPEKTRGICKATEISNKDERSKKKNLAKMELNKKTVYKKTVGMGMKKKCLGEKKKE